LNLVKWLGQNYDFVRRATIFFIPKKIGNGENWSMFAEAVDTRKMPIQKIGVFIEMKYTILHGRNP